MDGEEDEILEKGKRKKETEPNPKRSIPLHFNRHFPSSHQPRRLAVIILDGHRGLQIIHTFRRPSHLCFLQLSNPLLLTATNLLLPTPHQHEKAPSTSGLPLGFLWAACPAAGRTKDQSGPTCIHQYLPLQMELPQLAGETGMLIAMLFPLQAGGASKQNRLCRVWILLGYAN